MDCPFVDAAGKHYMQRSFYNSVEAGSADNSQTLAWLNFTDPTANDPDIDGLYVRAHTYSNDDDCAAAPQGFSIGMAKVAGTRPGVSWAAALVEPFIMGLLGFSAPGVPPTAGRCMLGQTRTIAVVEPTDGCGTWLANSANWPPGSTTPGQYLGRVVGFVNVVFTQVRCGLHTTVPGSNAYIDTSNCNPTNPNLSNCTGDGTNLERVDANIYCDLPTGFPPRLVQTP
jgi:hypothetical protein